MMRIETRKQGEMGMSRRCSFVGSKQPISIDQLDNRETRTHLRTHQSLFDMKITRRIVNSLHGFHHQSSLPGLDFHLERSAAEGVIEGRESNMSPILCPLNMHDETRRQSLSSQHPPADINGPHIYTSHVFVSDNQSILPHKDLCQKKMSGENCYQAATTCSQKKPIRMPRTVVDHPERGITLRDKQLPPSIPLNHSSVIPIRHAWLS